MLRFSKKGAEIERLKKELSRWRKSDLQHRLDLDILVNTPDCHRAIEIREKYRLIRKRMDEAIKALKN